MGHTTYSCDARSVRSASLGYFTKGVDEIFTQQKERRIHDSMSPKGVDFRECRDSEAHPAVVPIIVAIDCTGSMGRIPHELIKDGLPTLMSGLAQNGVDAAVLFLGIGDHECDHYPLQVGQFESGDEELDLWLTRTYIEGGGGGNRGESYMLPWYFAANHTVTDAWEKRRQKGYLFTIGDEPCLRNLPKQAQQEIMGETARGQVSGSEDLLKVAQEKWNVFHLNVNDGAWGRSSIDGWKKMLGQNCIEVENYRDIADIIKNTVQSHEEAHEGAQESGSENQRAESSPEETML